MEEVNKEGKCSWQMEGSSAKVLREEAPGMYKEQQRGQCG
jgi:hypothetical protein